MVKKEVRNCVEVGVKKWYFRMMGNSRGYNGVGFFFGSGDNGLRSGSVYVDICLLVV